jgi:hypothetical protein
MTRPLVTVAPGPHGKEAKRPPRGGAGRTLPALCAGLVSGEASRFWSKEEARP